MIGGLRLLGGRALQWLRKRVARLGEPAPLTVIRTDELPERPAPRYVYIVGERGEDWYAAMLCPCHCGAVIELNLVPPGRPCWKLTIHVDGTPTLTPSVWRQVECRSHFFLRRGRIAWAEPNDVG
jgi:uncharacterized protein DUF6527